ncbi:hypothetical protein BGW80DRAFT_373037 [Lactifluus volemus]|nr:hypothetical protein BGW80DRAFT_373037 [Lactifluus volemus]
MPAAPQAPSEEVQREDYDEIEYMAPTAIDPPYTPHFDMPDLKLVGAHLFDMMRSLREMRLIASIMRRRRISMTRNFLRPPAFPPHHPIGAFLIVQKKMIVALPLNRVSRFSVLGPRSKIHVPWQPPRERATTLPVPRPLMKTARQVLLSACRRSGSIPPLQQVRRRSHPIRLPRHGQQLPQGAYLPPRGSQLFRRHHTPCHFPTFAPTDDVSRVPAGFNAAGCGLALSQTHGMGWCNGEGRASGSNRSIIRECHADRRNRRAAQAGLLSLGRLLRQPIQTT